jgi:hypothetical protein
MVTSHSLRSAACQTIMTRRPPGRSARPMLANAMAGLAKNIVPNRLIATSKRAAGNWWTCASARSKVALRRPSARASSRARSIAGAETSIPRALPAAAVCAACRVVCPLPQPTSRTWSRDWIPQAPRSASLCRRSSAS